jgi:mannan endo-1,4-beta-mannosidase
MLTIVVKPMSSYYNQLVDLGNDQKLIAATEVGSAPLPDLLKLYEAHWSWFCVWNAPFINDPEWNSPANLETVSERLARFFQSFC